MHAQFPTIAFVFVAFFTEMKEDYKQILTHQVL